MTILSKIRNGFLKIFGDIKIFKFPFFILYDPGSYKIKGNEVRTVINTIKKGDILVRGYTNYLDGVFIPGFFSHTGLFLGKTVKSDLKNPDTDQDKFHEGEQVVIHAMAEGVFMEDVISFCRCDYLIILRRNSNVEPGVDFDNGFETVYKKALIHLGKDYDFKFDFSDNGNMSCTELVYVCNEDYLSKYKVKIKERNLIFKKIQVLLPDDFVTNEFEIVFASSSIKKTVLENILQKNSN